MQLEYRIDYALTAGSRSVSLHFARRSAHVRLNLTAFLTRLPVINPVSKVGITISLLTNFE